MIHAVSLLSVAKTDGLRLDAHHFHLRKAISKFIEGLEESVPLTWPWIQSVRNGENLSSDLYIQDDTAWDALYASVGALSQFTLRPDNCVKLRSDLTLTESMISDLSASQDEVWVTRSGTPGIAWAPIAQPEELVEAEIIPSGFVIRLYCNSSALLPGYVAAVLNHPIWRIWSSSLAAGKRQRNLSQEHLASIKIPMLSMASQRALQTGYLKATEEIAVTLSESSKLVTYCDAILKVQAQLAPPFKAPSMGIVEAVSLTQLEKERALRIDHRSLRADLRATKDYVYSLDGMPLGALIVEVIRSGQPTLLPIDENEDPRIIATGSIQFGQVIPSATKQGAMSDLIAREDKLVSSGDLLIAMDGEGSIGKVAVFDGDYTALCDSHIAIVRLSRPELAEAIACFMNSRLGQSQIGRLISGSTGQLQVSMDDLLTIWVPSLVIDRFDDISSAYKRVLEEFESLTTRVRRRVCELSLDLNKKFIAEGAISETSADFLRQFHVADDMLSLLSILKPRMF